jgi:hypothetical protein
MLIALDVRADFGTHTMSDVCCGENDGGRVWTGRSGPYRFRWTGADNAKATEDGSLHAVADIDSGADHDLVLELSDNELDAAPIRAEDAWRATEHAWAQAVPAITDTLADRDNQVAYAVLRGLTNSDGGMVAAATTSLPERAEQGRNYDYRYCWIRDQCYAGQAMAAAGGYPLLDDAVRFVSERVLADGPELRPAYSVDGSPPPCERDLDLPGYPGAGAKTGNWVSDQFQLDVHGEALPALGPFPPDVRGRAAQHRCGGAAAAWCRVATPGRSTDRRCRHGLPASIREMATGTGGFADRRGTGAARDSRCDSGE